MRLLWPTDPERLAHRRGKYKRLELRMTRAAPARRHNPVLCIERYAVHILRSTLVWSSAGFTADRLVMTAPGRRCERQTVPVFRNVAPGEVDTTTGGRVRRMRMTRTTWCGRLAIAATLLLTGCVYDARQRVDQSLCAANCHPYDCQPAAAVENPAGARGAGLPRRYCRAGRPGHGCPQHRLAGRAACARASAGRRRPFGFEHSGGGARAEARRIELSQDPAAKQRQIQRLYPELPPLPASRPPCRAPTAGPVPWPICSNLPRPTARNCGRPPATWRPPAAT